MTTIPLNKLTVWAENVRKTGASDGIDELAASIAAHGLLQSLVVRKAARGKFAVVAGGRRLLALNSLVERGQVAPDMAVECHVIEADTDATEIGLAENVVRRPMHPADQFEAFAALITKGASVADVAARFGVTVLRDGRPRASLSTFNPSRSGRSPLTLLGAAPAPPRC